MADWSAQQYLKFEDERTRPPRDLLAQVPLTDARKIVDVGCGPGNSTELLVKRWPNATVIGIDTSTAMLRQARLRLPNQTFIEANVAHWVPPDGTDLLFANAVFQWVPGHLKQLQRLLGRLPEGGVLAAQIPDSLDEPTNDLDVDTLRALEEALEDFAGCAVIISHDRWFLDRIATHILAFEGDSHVEWFEGNFQDYEKDKMRRLGQDSIIPHRVKYKKLTR